jgi:iron(III) transport system ATP-binding protein
MSRHTSTLTVRGVAKSYGSTAVLSDVDLTVPAGGFAAVLGPSGSGKTTLLRLIAGFDQPDQGRIALNGDTFDDGHLHVPAHRRGIGYVPQEGLLFPHLSVAENVGFGLPRRKRSGRRVTDLLELIGLGGLGHRRPHELSGGQQQRVAVARALAPEPRLILLDEPFAALDASLRDSLRLEIKQLLASLGTTVVLVTHDQEEALSLADVVAILYDGRIVQHATPRAIYQHPETLAVAHFLGDTNLVAAHFNGGSAHTPLGELLIEDGSQSKGEGLVLIRPEQILLTPCNNGHRPPLTARVTAVTYFGHDAIARLSLETGNGPLELIARTRGDLAPRVDAHVTLAFDGAMRTYDEGA